MYVRDLGHRKFEKGLDEIQKDSKFFSALSPGTQDFETLAPTL